jgi:carbonic anhydrase
VFDSRIVNCQYKKEYFPSNMCVVPFILFNLIYLLLFNSHFSRADVHITNWDHDHHHTHSENWEGTCQEGLKQAPINIVTNETVVEKWGQPFVFHGYEKRHHMHTKNNRHSVVVELDNNTNADIWI